MMAGLEVVVRPVIFPDIRPRPRQALPPQDDPTKGFAVIQGNPTLSTSNSHSWSISMSRSNPVETERRVDETRIYQEEDDGTINRENFVDVEVANRITMAEPKGEDDKEVIPGDEPGVARSKTEQGKVYYYQPVAEAPNIEIKKHNKIKKADEDSG